MAVATPNALFVESARPSSSFHHRRPHHYSKNEETKAFIHAVAPAPICNTQRHEMTQIADAHTV